MHTKGPKKEALIVFLSNNTTWASNSKSLLCSDAFFEESDVLMLGEQLLSKKASKIIVKHSENENSITKIIKKHSKIDFPDLQFSCSMCFHSHYFRDLALYEVFLQSELSRDVF